MKRNAEQSFRKSKLHPVKGKKVEGSEKWCPLCMDGSLVLQNMLQRDVSGADAVWATYYFRRTHVPILDLVADGRGT